MLGLLLTSLVGFLLVVWISNRFHPLVYLGLAFPMGISSQTFGTFLWNFTGLNFGLTSILIVNLFILLVALLGVYSKYKPTSFNGLFEANLKSTLGEITLPSLFFIGLSTFVVYAISVKSMFWPTLGIDSLTSFDLYAKALAAEGTLLNSLIIDQRVGFGAAYPPLYSLSLSYSFILGFESSKIIPTLFFISFAIAFFGLTWTASSVTIASIMTLFALVTPEMLAQSAINTTSVPQASIAALGIMSLVNWQKTKHSGYFWLAVALLSANGFIRSEGIIYIGLAFLVVLLLGYQSRDLKKPVVFILFTMIPFVLWQVFLRVHADLMDTFVQVEISYLPNLDFENVSYLFGLALSTIFQTTYYGATIFVFLAFILLNGFYTLKHGDQLALLLIILGIFVGYVVLLNQFTLRADSMENVINYSGKRFFFGITNLIWFYIAANRFTNQIFSTFEPNMQLRHLFKSTE
jgi:hypothetical protein